MKKMNHSEKNFQLLNITAALGLLTMVVYILHVGRNLILPLIIALAIWYVISQFTNFFFKIFKIHYSICLIVSILISGVIFYVFVFLLTSSVGNIMNQVPSYQKKMQVILNSMDHWTNYHIDAKQLFSKINLSAIFSNLAFAISSILSNFVLIIIYLLFLFLEAKTFDGKLKILCSTQSQYHSIQNIFSRIRIDINKYLRAKTMINASAGIASYIALLCFHVDYSEFWGIFIFLLHFIPFVGPITAVIGVMLAVSVQIDSILVFWMLAIILALIQFGIGNILEPKLVGTRLNLSPIVILFSLAFWGSIWGLVGMFLCVPMMVILNIILLNFPNTQPIALILSANSERRRIH